MTSYDRDDGLELTSVSLSPNGEWLVFVRGGDHGANFDDPHPVDVEAIPIPSPILIWSIPFSGGEPRPLGEGDDPVISPRGNRVAFQKDGTLWEVPVDGSRPATRIVAVHGRSGSVVWSPDGSRIAFVSSRGDHAFVGIYRDPTTPIRWLAASTSRDSSPRWSPDGRRIVFVRRPGAGGAPEPILAPRHAPWSLWIADEATGTGHLLWKAPETLRGSFPASDGGANLHWVARGRIVFLSYVDGWAHLYSLSEEGGGEPLLLTPGGYTVEQVRPSPDGTRLVFAANIGDAPEDIDRRHVVMVPVDRAAPEVLTPGTGLEWTPVMTGGLDTLAFLSADARRPPLPAIQPLSGGARRRLAEDRIPSKFPEADLIVPKQVTYRSSDGLTVHAQLFFAEGRGAANEKRPAIVYVHGGPARQMLLGWHASDYYSRAYASNQFLASRGFVVLSVNYRLGIGYGYELHQPPEAGARGASEYLDVKAAAEYLRTFPLVDPSRIGIYGGSYGGYLTALALARDSDLFAAGVDMHGVHDFTKPESGSGRAFQAALAASSGVEKSDRDEAEEVAFRSSPVASIDTWKSPVLLIHGDDDRNVRFSQTVDLTRRLETAGVPFEELVIPDDTHHWMRHQNVVTVYDASAAFFARIFHLDQRKAR